MNTSQTQIKICGIKSSDIAYAAVKLGANYIGLIFDEASKRYVDLPSARKVTKAVKHAGGTPVAVFVNQSADEMIEIQNDLNIQVVQLHGYMARQQHIELPKHIIRIYVLTIGKEGYLINKLDASFNHLKPERDFLLFDGPRGGSGAKIMTNRLNDIAAEFNFFIAGGLCDTNVEETIHCCKPFAVDISSGVENNYGNKDVHLIKQFINRVKNVGAP